MTKIVPVPPVLDTPSTQHVLSMLAGNFLWVIISKNLSPGHGSPVIDPAVSGEPRDAPLRIDSTHSGGLGGTMQMLPGDSISMGAEHRPPSSADEADLGEVADVEGAVDVEDGIDSAVCGPPNSSVLHPGSRQQHSSCTSYFFFQALLRALLLRTRSRGADGGNGESPSIHEVSSARSHIMSSLLSSIARVSTASHFSGSNFLMRPFTLTTGISTERSTFGLTI